MHIAHFYYNDSAPYKTRTQSVRVGGSLERPAGEHRRSETDSVTLALRASDLPLTDATMAPIAAEPNDSENTASSNAPAASDQTTQRRVPGRVASPRTTLAPPAFRIPEFRWTAFHLRLLNDLLILVEQDVYLWKWYVLLHFALLLFFFTQVGFPFFFSAFL